MNIQDENLIFYFSGTGNSKAAAKDLSKLFKCSIVDINQELLLKLPEAFKCDRAIVVFPSYAYGMPKLVIEFLKKVKFECEYLALMVTYGSSPGGTLHSAKRILRRRGQKVDYFGRLKMVENYIPIFGAQKPERIKERLLNYKEIIKNIGGDVADKKTNKIKGLRPLSAVIRHIFGLASPLLAKMMKVQKTCTLCGICIKVCPANAITQHKKKRKVVIKAKKCNHCQACLNFCPQHSLQLLRMRPKTKQYINPDIKPNEMLRR